MGAPSSVGASGGDDAPPVPSGRPQVGVPLPGLPTRPRPSDEDEEQEGPNIPLPPRVPRSPTPPTPERETSPARIAVPVARSKLPELEAAEEPPSIPARAIEDSLPHHEEEDEPANYDPGRAAGAAVAAASFGKDAAPHPATGAGGKRAIVQYDHEKADVDEIELVEGQYVTNIEFVDDDWWMGTNEKGESGLFPSNYVELVEDGEGDAAPAAHEPEPAPAPAARPAAAAAAAPAGPTATAIYDCEAAEDNELSFPEGAKITGLVS